MSTSLHASIRCSRLPLNRRGGYTSLWMYQIPQKCTLQNSAFYAMWISLQFKKKNVPDSSCTFSASALKTVISLRNASSCSQKTAIGSRIWMSDVLIGTGVSLFQWKSMEIHTYIWYIYHICMYQISTHVNMHIYIFHNLRVHIHSSNYNWFLLWWCLPAFCVYNSFLPQWEPWLPKTLTYIFICSILENI